MITYHRPDIMGNIQSFPSQKWEYLNIMASIVHWARMVRCLTFSKQTDHGHSLEIFVSFISEEVLYFILIVYCEGWPGKFVP